MSKEHIVDTSDTGQTLRPHSLKNVIEQIQILPEGIYQASKYTTDDAIVITFWNEHKSFDIAIARPSKV